MVYIDLTWWMKKERALIEPARVERAAAKSPAIIIPETPTGNWLIINIGNISSDLEIPMSAIL